MKEQKTPYYKSWKLWAIVSAILFLIIILNINPDDKLKRAEEQRDMYRNEYLSRQNEYNSLGNLYEKTCVWGNALVRLYNYNSITDLDEVECLIIKRW